MPTNKPFFPNLWEVKKVITPKGEVLIQKTGKCGAEFMGRADQIGRSCRILSKKKPWLIFQFEPDSDGWTTGSTDPFPIVKMDEECASDAQEPVFYSISLFTFFFVAKRQIPRVLTCVSPKYVRNIKSRTAHITFRTLKKGLYWGYGPKKTRYGIYNPAEPEKALLDWIYFRRKKNLPLDTDEFVLSEIDRTRLLEYAERYPVQVENEILRLLVQDWVC